ncbi:hypothetical protein BKA64DRAFT_774602 [Cadophora sp. MPI-SDFR-AT-0126]|nr:hypothetical protein BKA64DRAFT_774602 [Leotiomycetes sp. MPI-SDFR-AT-0126]
MSHSTATTLVQVVSISTALIASGGILSLSLFTIPLLTSQPASRSLPQIRWLFSRGSHVFPPASIIPSTGFIYLAITSLPSAQSLTQIVNFVSNDRKVDGNLLAGGLSVSIALFTKLVMIPTNFELIERNEELGGERSEKSAREGEGKGKLGGRSARDSVEGKGDINEFGDLSGPQERTERGGTAEDERVVRELLEKFKWLNLCRAVLIGCGGVVGLVTAIA